MTIPADWQIVYFLVLASLWPCSGYAAIRYYFRFFKANKPQKAIIHWLLCLMAFSIFSTISKILFKGLYPFGNHLVPIGLLLLILLAEGVGALNWHLYKSLFRVLDGKKEEDKWREEDQRNIKRAELQKQGDEIVRLANLASGPWRRRE
jgi:hypothetical protein